MPKRRYSSISGYNAPRSSYKKRRYVAKPFIRSMSRRQYNNIQNYRTAGFLGMELKFFDTALAAGTVIPQAWTTAATVLSPDTGTATAATNSPAQGDGASSRDGREIAVTSVHLKGQVYIPSAELQTAPVSGTTIRYGFVLDKQNNATALSTKDMSNVFATQAADTYGFRNLEYTKRFQILVEKTIFLEAKTLSHFANDSFSWAKAMKNIQLDYTFKKPLKVNFTGTNGTCETITDNAIYPYVISATDAGALIAFNQRCRFRG